jgi:hypothetical protein
MTDIEPSAQPRQRPGWPGLAVKTSFSAEENSQKESQYAVMPGDRSRGGPLSVGSLQRCAIPTARLFDQPDPA